MPNDSQALADAGAFLLPIDFPDFADFPTLNDFRGRADFTTLKRLSTFGPVFIYRGWQPDLGHGGPANSA